jgi:hypothetical protein
MGDTDTAATHTHVPSDHIRSNRRQSALLWQTRVGQMIRSTTLAPTQSSSLSSFALRRHGHLLAWWLWSSTMMLDTSDAALQWGGGGGLLPRSAVSPTPAQHFQATTSTAAAQLKYRQLDVSEEVTSQRGILGPWPNHGLFRDTLKRRNNDIESRQDFESMASRNASTALLKEALDNPICDDRHQATATTTSGSSTFASFTTFGQLPAPPHVVTNVHELRQKILDEQLPLSAIRIQRPIWAASNSIASAATVATAATAANPPPPPPPLELSNHAVLQVLADRVASRSTPGRRAAHDTHHVALAIEGGGLRGAVCSGMAAAIATLGLTDAFDSVWGSSAGAVIGAYLVR